MITRTFTLNNTVEINDFSSWIITSSSISSWFSLEISSVFNSSLNIDQPTVKVNIIPSNYSDSSISTQFSLGYSFTDEHGYLQSFQSSSISFNVNYLEWINLLDLKNASPNQYGIVDINFSSNFSLNQFLSSGALYMDYPGDNLNLFFIHDIPSSSINFNNLKAGDEVMSINFSNDFSTYSNTNFVIHWIVDSSPGPEYKIGQMSGSNINLSYESTENGQNDLYYIWKTEGFQPSHTFSNGVIWNLDNKTLTFPKSIDDKWRIVSSIEGGISYSGISIVNIKLGEEDWKIQTDEGNVIYSVSGGGFQPSMTYDWAEWTWDRESLNFNIKFPCGFISLSSIDSSYYNGNIMISAFDNWSSTSHETH